MAAQTTTKKVDLVASGYEWTCPTCTNLNREVEVCESVTCKMTDGYRGCGATFEVGEVLHVGKHDNF